MLVLHAFFHGSIREFPWIYCFGSADRDPLHVFGVQLSCFSFPNLEAFSGLTLFRLNQTFYVDMVPDSDFDIDSFRAVFMLFLSFGGSWLFQQVLLLS
jgi:hypothetical protein